MVGGDWRTPRAVVLFTLLWILSWFHGYRWALALWRSDSGRGGADGLGTFHFLLFGLRLFPFFSFSLFLFDWLMSWGPRSSGPRGCLFFFLFGGFLFPFSFFRC